MCLKKVLDLIQAHKKVVAQEIAFKKEEAEKQRKLEQQINETLIFIDLDMAKKEAKSYENGVLRLVNQIGDFFGLMQKVLATH